MRPANFSPFLIELLGIVATAMRIIGIFLLLGTFKTGSKVFPLPARMSADQAHITNGIMVW